jgi:hypothetical protein
MILQVRAITTVAIGLAFTAAAHAVVIGTENFDYADGPIANQTGGGGFDWDNTTRAHTGTFADWDNVGGTPQVASGALITSGSSAKREYNGPTEGTGTSPATDERLGAFQGVGTVYYSVQMTRNSVGTPGNTWSGLSTYDFGTERLFLGVPSAGTAFGINAPGGSSSMQAVTGQTYTLVAGIHFDRDLASLWVDPNIAGSNPVAQVAYTASNWSTAVRLGSGPGTSVTWDNLRVATSYIEAVGPTSPDMVFYDDFNDPNGTALPGKSPDIGQAWTQPTGTALAVQNDRFDTTGGARVVNGSFTRAQASGDILVLDFVTADASGSVHTNGFAGISLLVGSTERIYIGDLAGTLQEWGVATAAAVAGVGTGVNDESVEGRFRYDYDSGYYSLELNGVTELTGLLDPGLALSGLRISNNGGGDIALDALSVSFVIPTPAALPAGLALLGLLAARRRR